MLGTFLFITLISLLFTITLGVPAFWFIGWVKRKKESIIKVSKLLALTTFFVSVGIVILIMMLDNNPVTTFVKEQHDNPSLLWVLSFISLGILFGITCFVFLTKYVNLKNQLKEQVEKVKHVDDNRRKYVRQ